MKILLILNDPRHMGAAAMSKLAGESFLRAAAVALTHPAIIGPARVLERPGASIVSAGRPVALSRKARFRADGGRSRMCKAEPWRGHPPAISDLGRLHTNGSPRAQ